MPARKWIQRSRNSKPDSVNSAIEPSLERTAGQTLPSRVVVVDIIVIVEVVVVLVVLFLFLFGLSVVLRVHRILLVFGPWSIAEPRHERLLRTVPALTCETGVVTVGRHSAGL